MSACALKATSVKLIIVAVGVISSWGACGTSGHIVAPLAGGCVEGASGYLVVGVGVGTPVAPDSPPGAGGAVAEHADGSKPPTEMQW